MITSSKDPDGSVRYRVESLTATGASMWPRNSAASSRCGQEPRIRNTPVFEESLFEDVSVLRLPEALALQLDGGDAKVDFQANHIAINGVKYPHKITQLPYPVEAFNEHWKVADVPFLITVDGSAPIAEEKTGSRGTAGGKMKAEGEQDSPTSDSSSSSSSRRSSSSSIDSSGEGAACSSASDGDGNVGSGKPGRGTGAAEVVVDAPALGANDTSTNVDHEPQTDEGGMFPPTSAAVAVTDEMMQGQYHFQDVDAVGHLSSEAAFPNNGMGVEPMDVDVEPLQLDDELLRDLDQVFGEVVHVPELDENATSSGLPQLGGGAAQAGGAEGIAADTSAPARASPAEGGPRKKKSVRFDIAEDEMESSKGSGSAAEQEPDQDAGTGERLLGTSPSGNATSIANASITDVRGDGDEAAVDGAASASAGGIMPGGGQRGDSTSATTATGTAATTTSSSVWKVPDYVKPHSMGLTNVRRPREDDEDNCGFTEQQIQEAWVALLQLTTDGVYTYAEDVEIVDHETYLDLKRRHRAQEWVPKPEGSQVSKGTRR